MDASSHPPPKTTMYLNFISSLNTSLYLWCKNCTYITGNISLGGENKNIPNLFQYNFVFIQKHKKSTFGKLR
jgi:hypothetical protein